MNPIKRLTATVTGQFDQAIRRIENHDAVVGVSLDDLRQELAHARVRHQRVRAERERREQRRHGQQQAASQWRDRARRADDEGTGLECLKRAKACDREAEALASGIDEQRRAEEKLARAIEQLEQRHRDLEAQRQTLRGREAAARANAVAQRSGTNDDQAIDETLERWQVDVTAAELKGDTGGDRLAEEFAAAETDAELRAELAALRDNAREG
jgi:phage shock protein A